MFIKNSLKRSIKRVITNPELPLEIWEKICDGNYELAWKLQDYRIMKRISIQYNTTMTIKITNDEILLYRDDCWRYKTKNSQLNGILGLFLLPSFFKRPVVMWTLTINDIVIKCPGNVAITAIELAYLFTRMGKPLLCTNYDQNCIEFDTILKAGHKNRGVIHLLHHNNSIYGYYIYNGFVLDIKKTWPTTDAFNMFLKCLGAEHLLRNRNYTVDIIQFKYNTYNDHKQTINFYNFIKNNYVFIFLVPLLSLILVKLFITIQ